MNSASPPEENKPPDRFLITVDRWFEWQIAGLMRAPVPFLQIVPAVAISIFAFPLAAMIVSRTDRWRLGR